MSTLRLYRGGQLAYEDRRQLEAGDVLVEDGKIKAVGMNLPSDGAEIIECGGKILLPSFYDLHVHAREPGQEGKETIFTAAQAAINGGVTGIVMMPNTVPALDSGSLVSTVLEKGKQTGIEVQTSGCITKDRAGKELAAISAMAKAGALFLTDDGFPVSNPQVLRRAMEYAKDFGLFLASHAETMELSGHGCMNEGKVSYRLGLPGIPAISEEICLDRDIRLGQYTGTHIHIQHVTTAIGMQTIRRAKEDGVHVTCEVAPHHLIFNEDHILDYDTNYKMNPPLRTPEDNERLLQGLIDGVFDVIATDHAPHTEFEKATDFVSAPFGITGLETALPSLFHYFIKPGKFGWDLLVKRYSAEPRRILNREVVKLEAGSTADFLVFDPAGMTHFTKDFMKSRSSNTPFLNQKLEGRLERVIYHGKEITPQ